MPRLTSLGASCAMRDKSLRWAVHFVVNFSFLRFCRHLCCAQHRLLLACSAERLFLDRGVTF